MRRLTLAFTIALAVFISQFANASLKELGALQSPFVLAPLPYAANSLEAAIDAETMNLHHGKHHQSYIDNLNKALGQEKSSLQNLMATMARRDAAVRNNAGGHWNHSFFWTVMTPDAKSQAVPKRLQKEIEKKFGSMDKFKEAFEKASAAQFGSGWGWLIRDTKGELIVTSTPNQDNPLMEDAKVKGTPIFGADVWEHAYYLRYQNKRPDYLKNFWKIVNWKQVDEYDQEALAAMGKK